MLLALAVLAASNPTLNAQVSVNTVPAGGVTQIRVTLAQPVALVSGEIIISPNYQVFGKIIAANVISATGDQVGSASLQNGVLDVKFNSPSGGIGRLPNVPILTVDIPVLSTAATTTVSQVTVQAGTVAWSDLSGVTWALNPVPGFFTVGGASFPWVKGLTPGGGPLTAGATVRMDGGNFAGGATVAIDGVAVSSTQVLGASALTFTVAGPADLTGKHVAVTNPDGSTADYYSSLQATVMNPPSSGPFVTPILPLTVYSTASLGYVCNSTATVALENQNTQPVEVVFQDNALLYETVQVSDTSVTIAPGSIYIQPLNQFPCGARFNSDVTALATSPVRVALVNADGSGQLVGSGNLVSPPINLITIPAPGPSAPTIGVQLTATSPLIVNWQAGTAAPAPVTVAAMEDGFTTFTVSASGGAWLSVSPAQGTTCYYLLSSASACPASARFAVAVNPTGLPPGSYQGTVTVTPNSAVNTAPTVFPVNLVVSTQPTLAVNQTFAQFAAYATFENLNTESIQLTSNGGATPFTVQVSTASGQNWLNVSPTQGTTPATLTVSATLSSFSGTSDSGAITITGPGNTLTIPATVSLQNPVPSPGSLQISLQLGQSPPPARFFFVSPEIGVFTVTAQTSDGAPWLQVGLVNTSAPSIGFSASVNPAGLAPGTYQGALSVNAPALPPEIVPVTLTIWSDAPPALTASVSSLAFGAPAGASIAPNVAQSFDVALATGTLPVAYSVVVSTSGAVPGWLTAAPVSGITPATLQIAVAPLPAAGFYQGTVTITAPPGSTNTVTIPVTYQVLPPVAPAEVAKVVNAASQVEGAVAPGEIVTLFGENMGPYAPAAFRLGANGKAATIMGGVSVMFDDVAAPLIYTSSTQINAIVPYEIAGKTSTVVSLISNGNAVFSAALPVAAAAPAIFTLSSTGLGAGAVLNSDNSVNSAANPAARGSVVQIFATGVGVTSPPGVTGEITATDNKPAVLPVTVTIGEASAQIVYAAAAPDAVSGLFQMNAVVPQSVTPGAAAPVEFAVGGAQSPSGVTIAVK